MKLRAGTQGVVLSMIVTLLLASGTAHAQSEAGMEPVDRIPTTVVGPEAGEVRWLMPESRNELGYGAEIRMMIDYDAVPQASLGAFIVTTTATGIVEHAHIWQAEIIYVISGSGYALRGDGNEEVPLKSGSVLYVPERSWHGFRNTDPDDRLKLLIITSPTSEGGLADFFRAAATRPGEEPLDLTPAELADLFLAYGMEMPDHHAHP